MVQKGFKIFKFQNKYRILEALSSPKNWDMEISDLNEFEKSVNIKNKNGEFAIIIDYTLT